MAGGSGMIARGFRTMAAVATRITSSTGSGSGLKMTRVGMVGDIQGKFNKPQQAINPNNNNFG